MDTYNHIHEPYEERIGSSEKVVRPVIAAFDFDVTMTTRDTFLPFLEMAFGKRRVRLEFLKLGLEASKVVLGLSSRDRFKEKIVRALFLGESVDQLHRKGREYALELQRLIRPAALQRIEWHKENGHRLIMVSASLDLYLAPLASTLGFDDLLCTIPSVNHLVFDGGLKGGNCRGPEKVRRLESILGNLSNFEIYAYGDSAGDKELLEIADHPYWRAFHGRRLTNHPTSSLNSAI